MAYGRVSLRRRRGGQTGSVCAGFVKNQIRTLYLARSQGVLFPQSSVLRSRSDRRELAAEAFRRTHRHVGDYRELSVATRHRSREQMGSGCAKSLCVRAWMQGWVAELWGRERIPANREHRHCAAFARAVISTNEAVGTPPTTANCPRRHATAGSAPRRSNRWVERVMCPQKCRPNTAPSTRRVGKGGYFHNRAYCEAGATDANMGAQALCRVGKGGYFHNRAYCEAGATVANMGAQALCLTNRGEWGIIGV